MLVDLWGHLDTWVLDIVGIAFALDFVRDWGAHWDRRVGHFLLEFAAKVVWKVLYG